MKPLNNEYSSRVEQRNVAAKEGGCQSKGCGNFFAWCGDFHCVLFESCSIGVCISGGTLHHDSSLSLDLSLDKHSKSKGNVDDK
eukprot:13428725-Ditylum_brightwellii.AAC.1